MANVSQGVTVSWGGTALSEIVSVNVDGIESAHVNVTPRNYKLRAEKFSPTDVDYGSVSVTARGTALASRTNVGLTAVLSISGPGVSLSFPTAIFQKLAWSAAVGELQTYTATFKLSG